MNIVEFYHETPVDRHAEIIVAGDRLFFDEDEYIIAPDGELRLVYSHKELEQKLVQIGTKLDIK